MSTLFVIFFLSLIILIHEFGHDWAAVVAGVEVISFSIGLGPTIYTIKKKNTKYSLRLLPFGGFVQLAGLDECENIKVTKSKRYDNQGWGRRFLIISAGSLMNIFLTIVVFVLLYSIVGVPQGTSSAIGTVLPQSPAQQAGLLAGDQLLAVNNYQGGIEQLVAKIHKSSPGKKLTLKLKRKEKIIYIDVKPQFNDQLKASAIGITLRPLKYQRKNIFTAIFLGFQEALLLMQQFFIGIAQLFTGFNIKQISGPVGIIHFSGQVFDYGLLLFLRFFAFLSLYIGMFNLLPLPALDGGRLLFLLAEKMIGKPINKGFEKYVHIIGFVLLLGLFIVITYNDVQRLIIGR